MRYPKWFSNNKKKSVDVVSEAVIAGTDLPPIEEVRAFMRNTVWKYMLDTINFRIKSARDDLEDQRLDTETIRVYQGRIEELRFIGDFPAFIIDTYIQLKAELDAKKEAEKSNEPVKEEKSWVRN